ncbi:hypothetical protein JG688_00014380 [Phytophthora aleatoria]|uniref:Uncharacterized protein n=1 Tax=Phytophthora aleatoria TaxID=2496075 RepID=A0A8J5IK09_9STRA|nr:hypothetical protein JG688_00014380 [Phytophthora aleatoria]
MYVYFGLLYNTSPTTAFREMMHTLTGDSNATLPSIKTYNDVLDNHYATFECEVSTLLVATVDHDLCTTKAKNCIVGGLYGFIDHGWRPRKLALIAQVKTTVTALSRSGLVWMYLIWRVLLFRILLQQHGRCQSSLTPRYKPIARCILYIFASVMDSVSKKMYATSTQRTRRRNRL